MGCTHRVAWHRWLMPFAFAFGIAAFAEVDVAKADFRVCNGTQSLVGVAVGYRAEAGWISEGWWRIPATACKSIIEGPLNSRYYYIYAEDADGQGRWGGEIDMCIAENEFKIAGVSDCLRRGYQSMGFREYDTGEQGSWMVQLTDVPSQPGSEQPADEAEAAGESASETE